MVSWWVENYITTDVFIFMTSQSVITSSFLSFEGLLSLHLDKLGYETFDPGLKSAIPHIYTWQYK